MLTFPAGYTAADLDLARAVEGRLGLGEMHVFWTGARSAQERAPSSLAAAPGVIASVLIVVDALMDAVGEMARGAGRSRRQD